MTFAKIAGLRHSCTLHYVLGPRADADPRDALDQISEERRGLLATLDAPVVGEVFMGQAGRLAALDWMLREIRDDPRPFGGLFVIFVGDSAQIAPALDRAQHDGMLAFQSTEEAVYGVSAKRCLDDLGDAVPHHTLTTNERCAADPEWGATCDAVASGEVPTADVFGSPHRLSFFCMLFVHSCVRS